MVDPEREEMKRRIRVLEIQGDNLRAEIGRRSTHGFVIGVMVGHLVGTFIYRMVTGA